VRKGSDDTQYNDETMWPSWSGGVSQDKFREAGLDFYRHRKRRSK
jgi:hypothetical protein